MDQYVGRHKSKIKKEVLQHNLVGCREWQGL